MGEHHLPSERGAFSDFVCARARGAQGGVELNAEVCRCDVSDPQHHIDEVSLNPQFALSRHGFLGSA